MKNKKTNEESSKEANPIKPNLLRDGFFGWSNFKWLVVELRNIYSNKDSFFSKKRIESGIAFAIAQFGMIFFLMEKYTTLTMGEFLLWAAAEFAVSGYIINKIQKEKKKGKDSMRTDAPPPVE